MLIGVKLDDEPHFEADEIGDEAPHQVLAPEFQATELSAAQAPPERLLPVDRVAAHVARGRPEEGSYPLVGQVGEVIGAALDDLALIRPSAEPKGTFSRKGRRFLS